ncbi:MAG: chromosomal replication initiator protein DnaA, partial [Synergistaceae bacterium]|nr:chromosomal replication initiator protein DnaA [Synergistaceae bacterium]
MEKNLDAIWRDVLSSSEEILPEGVNEIWLATCHPVSIENDTLLLEASNPFIKSKMDSIILAPLVDFLTEHEYARSAQVRVAYDAASD